jgi:hypothetical protein
MFAWMAQLWPWRVGGTSKSPPQPEANPMAQQYQGKNIKSQREAREGDEGFKQGAADQVTITMEDGTEKVVKRSEVTGQPQQGQQSR